VARFGSKTIAVMVINRIEAFSFWEIAQEVVGKNGVLGRRGDKEKRYGRERDGVLV